MASGCDLSVPLRHHATFPSHLRHPNPPARMCHFRARTANRPQAGCPTIITLRRQETQSGAEIWSETVWRSLSASAHDHRPQLRHPSRERGIVNYVFDREGKAPRPVRGPDGSRKIDPLTPSEEILNRDDHQP